MAPKKKKGSSEYDGIVLEDTGELLPVDEELVAIVMKAPDKNAGNNIRVAIRIRPPNARELAGGASNVIVHKQGDVQVLVGDPSDRTAKDNVSFTYGVIPTMPLRTIEFFFFIFLWFDGNNLLRDDLLQ